MQEFAALLGWKCLELYSCAALPDRIKKEVGLERIYLYQTSDDKFNLQINEEPLDQTVTHKATIKADRYGVVRIDWIPFTLFSDEREMREEAERIFPDLARSLWKSKAWRQERLHEPGAYLLPSKKKRRGFARRQNRETKNANQ